MLDKKTILTVDVNIKDTELFRNVLVLFGEIFTDERIDNEIRTKYVCKLADITNDR